MADIKGIDPEVMKVILTFIYTEKITLSRENVFRIHAASDYMQMTGKVLISALNNYGFSIFRNKL